MAIGTLLRLKPMVRITGSTTWTWLDVYESGYGSRKSECMPAWADFPLGLGGLRLLNRVAGQNMVPDTYTHLF